MAILRCEHVTYLYGAGTPVETAAVNDVTLNVEEGEILAVIGHTGSGKSTLIQHFNGLLRADSGTVYLRERDIWADKSKIRGVRFQVGLCFQYPEYQIFEETVYQEIAFGPKQMGLDAAEIEQRIQEAIRFVELDGSYLEKSPFDLSGGEKRRVALASILAMRPSVLILDAPTAGLDPRGRDLVLRLIRSYQKEQGNTVILVSHSMEDVAKLAHRVVVMNHSRLAMEGTVAQVYARGEELKGMGLNVPQITQVFLALRERGIDCSTEIFTVEQGRAEFLRLMREKGGGAQ
ncbi:MAG: energy-coupling factor transporter ATPase [Clostridiales bacterium]|nr:energy-coupling factor transporter ATPase [Clostridiales bacterium]